MENVRLNLKLLAVSLQVRGEKVTVFIAILFYMATSSIFHSCFSFQMCGFVSFYSWCCWTSCPLECFAFCLIREALQAHPSWKGLFIQWSFCRTTYVISKPIPSVFLSLPLCEKRLDSWTDRYYINTIRWAAISPSVVAVGSPVLYSCRKEMVLTSRIPRIFPVQYLERAATWNRH